MKRTKQLHMYAVKGGRGKEASRNASGSTLLNSYPKEGEKSGVDKIND